MQSDDEPLAVLLRELPRLAERVRPLNSPVLDVLVQNATTEVARLNQASQVPARDGPMPPAGRDGVRRR